MFGVFMIEIIYQINNFIEITQEKNQEYLRYRLEIKEFLLFFLTTNGFNKSKFFSQITPFLYIQDNFLLKMFSLDFAKLISI